MKPVELKVARIGNSRGVRIPADTLKRYMVDDVLIMEERSDGILLRAPARAQSKLSWEETAVAMAAAKEDWSDWDGTLSDSVAAIPWHSGRPARVAERKPDYKALKSKKR
jgi:antitoxin component of MazEF toxin-antitoxin module